MPSLDYNSMFGGYGTASNPFRYTMDAGQTYHPLSYFTGGGPGGATSTGPYDQSSALGSAYQAQTFDVSQADRLGQLGDIINQMNRNAQQQSLQARIPGAAGLETQSSANIGAELGGRVPQDVMQLLGQQAAERGVATGAPGSANANAAYLRALGLTSLGQEQVGQQNLTAAYARNPAAPIFDPTTQLITPYQGALIGESAANQSLAVNQMLTQANLEQQRLNQQAQRYAYPSAGYGGTTTVTSPLTGADVLGPYYTGPDYGAGAFSYNLPGDTSTLSSYYDYTPPGIDYGNVITGSPDYASTPVSMYG